MSQLTDEEIQEFRNEAAELLDQAEQDLLATDQGGGTPELFNSVFRVFHSLKGGAGMLGLAELQEHMHKVETRLAGFKENPAGIREHASFFLAAVDAARQLLAGNRVEFRYEPAKAEAPRAEKAKPAGDKLPLAYVVDDEPMIGDLLREYLESVGVAVQTFVAPKALLGALESRKPDVILSDMRMPEMNGLDLMKKVRGVDADVPVILVSAHLSKDVLIDAINAGVYAVIDKPFTEVAIVNHCASAIRYSQLSKLLNRTMNLLLYQYSDLDDFLKANRKEEVRLTLKQEVNNLIEQRKRFRALKRA